MAVRDMRIAIVVAAAAWACDSPLEPTMLGGTWGGEHVTMSIAESTHLEFDCAHGDVAARLSIDSGGHFEVTGTFTREHGGPIRVEEPPDIHSASYAGLVSDDRMTLTVRLTDTAETIGAFTLKRGTPGRVVKCL
jgi:hypothetical protein